jgi:propionate CoA-transferase
MSKLRTAAEVAQLVKDGATVAASGFGLAGFAEEVAIAIEQRFLNTGQPRNLTIVHAAGIGDWGERGMNHFGHEGLVKRWIGGHCGTAPKMGRLINEHLIEGYNLPQGAICQLYREIAGNRPGLLTKIGLGTFVDPRLDGGKLTRKTTEDIVKVVELEGEEWLLYKKFPVDVALIRGTTADEHGNITLEKEGLLLEQLAVAQAAKNTGGIVIAQVEYLATVGSLHPKQVKIPGIMVDYVVLAKPENHTQTMITYFNPAFAGDIRVPLSSIEPLALDERKIIARRSALELSPGAVVNLGIGVPEGVSIVAAEEAVGSYLTLTTEAGSIAGVPAGGKDFGHASNSEAILEQQCQFDFYDGGGVDVAFLGLAQTDADGNVNVSKFGPKVTGCGGFINITQSSKKVVFCGAFTAGGLKIGVAGGKLVIETEGRAKKFIKAVEQVTFSGRYASKVRQPVLYVTERAVFELGAAGMVLTEIAPGVDLDKDILAQMDFKPQIASNLKLMPAAIFNENWGQLKGILDQKGEGGR